SKPSPLQVGLQVPRGIRAQTTAESDLWEYPPTTGPGFPRAGAAEGVPDRGGTPDAGSRAHVHRDSAEASSRFGDRFLEREEREMGYLLHSGRPYMLGLLAAAPA